MTSLRELTDRLERIRLRAISPDTPAAIGIGVVGGIGAVTLSIHLIHLMTSSGSLVTALLGAGFPLFLSLILIAIGGITPRRYSRSVVLRIAGWCVVGTLVLVAVSAISMVYQQSKGVLFVNPLFVVTTHATVGAIIGSLLGLYDGQRHSRGHELRVERERAEQLSDRLTILNRVLRHDIRNNVDVIRGNAELLLNDERDRDTAAAAIDEKASELEAASTQARRLERLLARDATDLAVIDLGTVLRATLDDFTRDHPDVSLETRIPDSIDIRAPQLLETVIDELLENAVEHNDSDSPAVEVSVSRRTCPEKDGPDFVTIRIRDNGPGIPDAELDVLERGEETPLRHSNGLGLWFARWVVELSDGRISYGNDERGGSTIRLHLPTASAADRSAGGERATSTCRRSRSS